MNLLLVALGGALGAVLRYLTGLLVAFPFGTLCVNVAGSFLIGVIFVWLTFKGADRASLFLMTGLLGGFTTFSTFSLDTLKLLERGHIPEATGYVLASVIGSLLAVFLGVLLARAVVG